MKTKLVILLILLLPSFGLTGGGLYAQHPELFNHSWFIQYARDNNTSNYFYDNFQSTNAELRFEIIFQPDKIIVEGCCGGIFEVEVNYIGIDEIEIISLSEIHTIPCQEGYVTSYYQVIKGFFGNMVGGSIFNVVQTHTTNQGFPIIYLSLSNLAMSGSLQIYNIPNEEVDDSLLAYLSPNTTDVWSLTSVIYQGEEYQLPYGAAFTVFDIYEGSFEIQLCGSVYGKMLFSWDWHNIGGPCFISCGELYTLGQNCEVIDGVDSTYMEATKQLIFTFLDDHIDNVMFWDYQNVGTPHGPSTAFIIGYSIISNDEWVFQGLVFHSNANYLSLNNFEKQGITIYPNPTSGHINIDIPDSVGTTGIRLVDLHGKTLLQNQSVNHGLDLSGFAAGVYFVEITTPQGKMVRKVIKR